MNEEKEDMYFVWEKGVRPGEYTPAIYRGMPMTGVGHKMDGDRFLLKVKLTDDEVGLGLGDLIQKYPKPEQAF